MTRVQTMVELHLTSGEVDVLAAIAREGGRYVTRQAALICRLRREYRKACKAAGIEPKARLLYQAHDGGENEDEQNDGVQFDEITCLCETLGDILDATECAREYRGKEAG